MSKISDKEYDTSENLVWENPEYDKTSFNPTGGIPMEELFTMDELLEQQRNQDNSLNCVGQEVRSHNVGSSDYSKHRIQPWSIWEEYNLNPWDADIVKRVLRTKEGNDRTMDYEKIIHVCQERIRQLKEN